MRPLVPVLVVCCAFLSSGLARGQDPAPVEYRITISGDLRIRLEPIPAPVPAPTPTPTPTPIPDPPPIVDADLGTGPGIWAPATTGSGNVPWHLTAAAASAREVRIAWLQLPATERYVVERSDDGASGWAEIARPSPADSITPPGYGTVVIRDAVAPGSTHHYRVWRLQDLGVVGAAPSPATVVITPIEGPWTPDGLMAGASGSSAIEVAWMPVPDATGYVLERSIGTAAWAAAYSGTDTRYRDASLSPGSAYRYRVRSLVGAAKSKWSPVIAETTRSAVAGRRLLEFDDLEYLGTFVHPYDAGGRVISYSLGGIAMKEGGPSPRLFGTYSGASDGRQWLFEFAPPPDDRLKKGPPFAQSTFVRNWGDPYLGRVLAYDGSPKRLVSTYPNAGGVEVHGIDFDPDKAEAWFSSGVNYNVNGDPNPSILRCRLDPATGTIPSAAGPWSTDQSGRGGPTELRTKGGSLRIPRWFADRHLGAGGRPFRAFGFGGGYSGVASGSGGLSLFAVAEDSLTAANECRPGQLMAEAPRVPTVCLSAFDYATTFMTRPPGYRSVTSGSKQPDPAGFGWWQWVDVTYGGACWVDNPDGTRGRHGLLLASTFGFGKVDYKAINVRQGWFNGGTCYDGGTAIGFAVVDPADLAAVAKGEAAPGSVRANPRSWVLSRAYFGDNRLVPYVGDHAGNHFGSGPTGMAFDPAANRLYASHRGIDAYGTIAIDVYRVD